jgi:hypothetical protein
VLGLFGRGSILESEDEGWQLDTWVWLLTHFGGLKRLKRSPIVTATRAFFPPTEAKSEARAAHIFECVKKHAKMTNWPCKLLAQPERPRGEMMGIGFSTDKGGLPLGTFSVADGEVTITYDPTTIGDPAVLVATLIHELAHYRLAPVRDEMPGGHEMHEFATDLMTVFLGFGLFGANRAFNFQQHGDTYSHGWRSSHHGYLREPDWSFALAVFLNLRSEPPESLKDFLKPHLYSDVKKAVRYLMKNDSLLEAHRKILSDADGAASTN